MRTYCVLLHVFAALLLCDYGMFSIPSPSPSEMSTTSGPNTTATTVESVTAGNDSSSLKNDQLKDSVTEYSYTTKISGNDQSNESILDDPHTTGSSEDYSDSGVTSSTAQPKEDPTRKDSTSDTRDSTTDTEAVIILIVILILIFFLLGFLYYLRKKGRSYSFDLNRVDVVASDYVDAPLRSDQQGISYELTNKDLPVCLDYVQEDKSEEKTNATANGSGGEKTEQTPTTENDYQNVPEENSFSSNSSLATSMKNEEFSLYLNLLGGESGLNDLTEAEATDTAQNENNNNVSNAGQGTAEEIFTEISLDEPKEHA